MQVSVETTSGVERRLTIGIPKESIEPKIKDRLKSLARQSQINGFRPGKVPMRLVEQRYGKLVRDEILGEVIQTSFSEALTQENLRPVSDASFDLKSDINNLEQGLSYTATFEVSPKFTTLHVDGLAVEKPVAKITEADVDTLLLRLRQQHQTWQEVDRLSIDGDRVVVSFVGAINGNPLKENDFKQIPVILGQKNFILPGFEEKLMGTRKGDDIEFDLTFPKEHTNPELAGQTVHFEVHVSKVEESHLPEIDENFVKSFGVADGSEDTLRIEARRNMERELKYVTSAQLKQQVLEALLKANPIDEVPPSLVEEETRHLLKTQQQKWQIENLHADQFKDEAQMRVKIGLLIGELIRIRQMQPNADKVRQMVENIARTSDNPDAVIEEYYTNKQRLTEVETKVLEDEIVDWLLDKAQITEKKTDFFTAVTI